MVLRSLRIENLVLIRTAELEFARGLNAITGETGAGKTILAQSIGLLLGARGDAAMIGPAGEEAYVEAELDGESEVLEELRPEAEPGLVLARRIFKDGRTRAYAWGRSAARELFLTGARFTAQRAREIGLVHAVAPEAELDAVVDGYLRELLTSGPTAVAAAKQLIASVAGRPVADVTDLTAQTIARQRVSPEGQDGMRAFLEKRKPSWHS